MEKDTLSAACEGGRLVVATDHIRTESLFGRSGPNHWIEALHDIAGVHTTRAGGLKCDIALRLRDGREHIINGLQSRDTVRMFVLFGGLPTSGRPEKTAIIDRTLQGSITLTTETILIMGGQKSGEWTAPRSTIAGVTVNPGALACTVVFHLVQGIQHIAERVTYQDTCTLIDMLGYVVKDDSVFSSADASASAGSAEGSANADDVGDDRTSDESQYKSGPSMHLRIPCTLVDVGSAVLTITNDEIIIKFPFVFGKKPPVISMSRANVTGITLEKETRRKATVLVHAKICREIPIEVQTADVKRLTSLLGAWDDSMPRGTMQEVIEFYISHGYTLVSRDEHGAQLVRKLETTFNSETETRTTSTGIYIGLGVAVSSGKGQGQTKGRVHETQHLIYVRADGSAIESLSQN